MKRIAYIGGQIPPGTNQVWGGWTATNNAFLKAFDNDSEFYIDMLERHKITGSAHIEDFCRGADIVHVDDTATVGRLYDWGIDAPDVIGPIARSPLKKYTMRGGGAWLCPYPADWFYGAKVIRLNYQEERKHKDKVDLVVHGVDSDMLRPAKTADRKNILWAGQVNRWAKNYELWTDIRNIDPPAGYQYQTLSAFAVEDYWRALDNAAVMVCTSRYESFCSCAFEAMAKGVPVVWQNDLQGGLWEDAGFRCEYTAEAFYSAILDAINDKQAGEKVRRYVEDHCTLKHMRDSYAQVYKEVINDQKTV